MQPNLKKVLGFIIIVILLSTIALWSVKNTEKIIENLDEEYPTLSFEEAFSGKVKSTYRHPELRYSNNVVHVSFQDEQKRTLNAISPSISDPSVSLHDVCVFTALIEKKAHSDTLIITYFDRVNKFILRID